MAVIDAAVVKSADFESASRLPGSSDLFGLDLFGDCTKVDDLCFVGGGSDHFADQVDGFEFGVDDIQA